MNGVRTAEDRLRAEYFELLPQMRRTLLALEADVRNRLVPIYLQLRAHEHLAVLSRVKDCESALDSLRRRQEARFFDPKLVEQYSLLALRDLVGVRVLAFPRRRAEQVGAALQPLFSQWTADPVEGLFTGDAPLALKYYGSYPLARTPITVEVQIVSSLIGSFWEVEHAALYKPIPDLQSVLGSATMKARNDAVISALRSFEDEFERLVREVNGDRLP